MARCFLVGFFVLGGCLSAAAAEPMVYALTPPKEVADALDRLRSGAERDEAKKTLAALDVAAPYLRLELAAAPDGQYKTDLASVLAAQAGRRFERNRTRMKDQDWVGECRFDLLASLLCACPDDNAALVIAYQIVRAHRHVMGEFGKRAQIKGPFIPYDDRDFHPRPGEHRAGDSITVKNVVFGPLLIRAKKCRIEEPDRLGWMLAVDDELDDPPPMRRRTEYTGAIGVFNCPAPFQDMLHCLFVVDGDVELRPQANVSKSLIICNGNVRASKELLNPVSNAMICATGDIGFPGCKKPPANAYFCAGGKVTFAEDAKGAAQVVQNQKELPFGVKFVDPRDFGLGVTIPFKAGVLVGQVAPDSVFAKYEVRPGDVVTRANGERTDTPAAFRKQLRRGAIDESVILTIVRDGKTITRIVFLDGVSKRP
jgi:hypothetical protein